MANTYETYEAAGIIDSAIVFMHNCLVHIKIEWEFHLFADFLALSLSCSHVLRPFVMGDDVLCAA